MTDAARVLDCFASLRHAFGGDITTRDGESISTAQLYAMQALNDHDRTAGELARAIATSLPSLTQLVDGLVDRGYVLRHPDALDRRKVWLVMTDRGRAFYARARQAAESRVADVLQDLSPEQCAALVAGLEALRGVMHARWLASRGRPEAADAARRS